MNAWLKDVKKIRTALTRIGIKDNKLLDDLSRGLVSYDPGLEELLTRLDPESYVLLAIYIEGRYRDWAVFKYMFKQEAEEDILDMLLTTPWYKMHSLYYRGKQISFKVTIGD